MYIVLYCVVTTIACSQKLLSQRRYPDMGEIIAAWLVGLMLGWILVPSKILQKLMAE